MIIGISGKIGSGKDAVTSLFHLFDYNLTAKEPIELSYIKQLYKYDPVELERLRKHLAEFSTLKIKRFADPLKRFTADLLGCDFDDLNDQEFKKSTLPVEWNKVLMSQTNTGVYDVKIMTVRDLLIAIGDGLRKTAHPNIWVNALINTYDGKSNWIIPDMRYKNELSSVRRQPKSFSIRIEREGVQLIDNESETGLDGVEMDYVINNKGTLEDLYHKAKSVFDDICSRLGATK